MASGVSREIDNRRRSRNFSKGGEEKNCEKTYVDIRYKSVFKQKLKKHATLSLGFFHFLFFLCFITYFTVEI